MSPRCRPSAWRNCAPRCGASRISIASLRAEWSKLDRPDRIQELAQRHLTLKPLEVRQYDTLDRLPERSVEVVPPGTADPIGAVIEALADPDTLTGSLPDAAERKPQ